MILNILVCIKQVPEMCDTAYNDDSNTIKRENTNLIINPYDRYAFNEAICIKQQLEDTRITVLCMGTKNCKHALQELLILGANEAILLSDSIFAGSDSFATAYALKCAIEKIGKFDLILCGRQAMDGNTEQVGPSLAEKLQIPYVTCIHNIESIQNDYLDCLRNTESTLDKIRVTLPALLTISCTTEDIRQLTIKELISSSEQSVRVLTSLEVDIDRKKCGLKGSRTKVVNTYTLDLKRRTTFLSADREGIELLISKLFA